VHSLEGCRNYGEDDGRETGDTHTGAPTERETHTWGHRHM